MQQPREAVSKADALSGKVIDENGNCIWEKSNRSNVNQIMKITADAVSEERSSVAVCIDTILSFEGVSRNSMQLLQAGKSLFDILQENLQGARSDRMQHGKCALLCRKGHSGHGTVK